MYLLRVPLFMDTKMLAQRRRDLVNLVGLHTYGIFSIGAAAKVYGMVITVGLTFEATAMARRHG